MGIELIVFLGIEIFMYLIIKLEFGGSFSVRNLIDYIDESDRDYIIQGQSACARDRHRKPSSLDYWLRSFATNPDTKQASNTILGKLENTGLFEIGDFPCPETNQLCKGIRLTQHASLK